MTAATLIRELAGTGIRLSVTGDRLHVEAKPGTVTDDLRRLLAENKTDLLAALSASVADQTARLLAAIRAASLPDALLSASAPKSGELAVLSDDALRAYVSTLADDAQRRAGRVPKDDTATLLCRSCGPVFVHPAIAAAMPTVAGIPRALGCPWCFVPNIQNNMAIPRPQVTCGTCRHFGRDKVNPSAGMGSCGWAYQSNEGHDDIPWQHRGKGFASDASTSRRSVR